MLKKLGFYELKHMLINDPHFFQWFLEEVTVNVTEMFRDPAFYLGVREQVVPVLKTYPFVKIWHAAESAVQH